MSILNPTYPVRSLEKLHLSGRAPWYCRRLWSLFARLGISEDEKSWGVTLFQANEEFDAGDVWESRRFHMHEASKTSLYKREVTGVAVCLIKQALRNIEYGYFTPRPLDYERPVVKDRKRPLMRQSDRMIKWHNTTMEVAIRKLNAADSLADIRDRINGIDVHMFGAVEEPNLKGRPGDILAIHEGLAVVPHRTARFGSNNSGVMILKSWPR